MSKRPKDIFTELYQKHSSYMYGICLRYTKNTDDAADVMQDGFLKIYNALDTFKGESNIKTWMSRIMVNTAINHYRHKKVLDFSSIEKVDYEVLKMDNNNVLSQMSTDELLEVINELPDGYRLVFNLYAIEGYKHREIAEMFNITEGTSKSQLAKARAKLQAAIAEKLGVTNLNEELKY